LIMDSKKSFVIGDLGACIIILFTIEINSFML
jgi:hypothetical protein